MDDEQKHYGAGDGIAGPEANGTVEPLKALRILIIDDEPLIADTLKRILNLHGFLAEAVYNGEAALKLAPELCPDIVLTDLRMPGKNGIDTGILLRKSCPHVRIILFSGQAPGQDLFEDAQRRDCAFDVWPKPLHPKDLVRRLQQL